MSKKLINTRNQSNDTYDSSQKDFCNETFINN